MTTYETLQAVAARGIRLELRLVVNSPRGAMTDELQAALVANKPHILAHLGREAQWQALSPKGDLNEPDADGVDLYAAAEREAIQQETVLHARKD
jgi:hypothetical protein